MSEGSRETRRWTDREGTEWVVRRRESVRGLDDGWILQRVGYGLVAFAAAPDEPSESQLQAWVDDHAGEEPTAATARLWTDPRSDVEWEVYQDAGELVFRRGVEVVRTPRGDNRAPPRAMDDEELQDALDRAQSEG